MQTYKVLPGVRLGDGHEIGDFVILGSPKKGRKGTAIGKSAVIRSHTVIYSGTKIGDRLQTGHWVLIREGNVIGNDVSIGTGSVIERDSMIGNGVRLHSNVFIPEHTEIRDNAWIGPNSTLTNAPHPLCPKAKECMKGPVIGEGAKIGANSTILPFVKIGKGAFVGAGSVVTKDVPDKAVVVGNPARAIKSTDDFRCRFGLVEKPYD